MKIIGVSEPGYRARYIAEISEDEIVHVCGFSYSSQEGFKAHMKELSALDQSGHIKVGVDIPVSNFWNRLDSIRQRQDELTKLARSMRALADLVDQASPAAILPPRED